MTRHTNTITTKISTVENINPGIVIKVSVYYLVFLILLFPGAISAQTKVGITDFKQSFNYGKSVAVFGGSVSVIPASDTAKALWKEYLGMTVTNYGVGGAGFSSLQGKSLQQQVNEAGVFDINIK